ncbi:hypothetical protein RF11_13989 [Thelohanellus kitauei]|uniref:EGF-like domain-containing protein n=1 Tax=Thelohanellus kitauei TaxID=669202 RepID=A0A0C2M1S2_THEKT|nr:hypothetical protein RF11_13989 [Thelohanellus kitauei]
MLHEFWFLRLRESEMNSIIVLFLWVAQRTFSNQLNIGRFREVELVAKITYPKKHIPENPADDWLVLGVELVDSALRPKVNAAFHEGSARVDFTLDDYFSEEYIYKNDLRVNLRLTSRYSPSPSVLVTNFLVNLYPNNYMTHVVKNENFKMSVYVMLKCQRYTGYNCQFDEIDNPRFSRDPRNGEVYCIKPPDCGDVPCENNFLCHNNGQCYVKTHTKEEYCVCYTGFYGVNCQNGGRIDEEILLFGKRSVLQFQSASLGLD